MGQTGGLFCTCDSVCNSLSITPSVSLLAIEFDVRSVLHGQVSFKAVQQSYFFHRAMKGCGVKLYALYFTRLKHLDEKCQVSLVVTCKYT